MKSETQKLSIREKIGYSLGDTASNLFFQTFILFLLYFYTDVFGITAKTAVTMFLVARIWDAINDPIMGMIADRTSTRWGKFRPYLIWGVIPLGVLGVLTFTTPGQSISINLRILTITIPELSIIGKIIYAYVTYILLTMTYTLINVPYSALMAVITPNSDERTVISSFRFVAAFVGQFIVQYAILKLVGVFADGNEAKGWQLAMAVLSALAIILYLITFSSTRERVKPIKEQKTPFRQDLIDLFTNKPWVLIAAATIFQLMYNCMRNGNIMYYFKYFVQDQQMVFFGKTWQFTYQDLTTAFMLSGTALTILGAILTIKLSRRFDKPKSYAGSLGITAIVTALYYFLGPKDIIIMFGLNLIISFTIGIVSVLQWAIYTDTTYYSEWKTGRRASGLLMSASLFALKLGIALGSALLAFILARYGFKANIQQTAETLTGIRLVMSIYPAIIALIGVTVIWFFYPLSNKMLAKIEEELSVRRQTSSNNN
jgi:GPH family glycoside/pentoside/hexuronide:cation symporter